MAGRGGRAGYWRVLGAGEGHCWVHEAEEGVSGVPLHLSQINKTQLEHGTEFNVSGHSFQVNRTNRAPLGGETHLLEESMGQQRRC